MATKMKIKKMNEGGRTGRSISQKAATRKTLKDKGYIVGSDSEGNKGSYVPYSKNQKNSTSSPGNVKDALSQSKTPRPIMQKGGSKKTKDSIEDKAVKRYPNYLGKDTAYDSAKKDVKSAAKDVKSAVKGAKTGVKTVVKALPSYQAAKGTDDFLEKRYPNYFGKGTMYSKVKKGIKSVFQNGGSTSSNTTPVKKVPAKTKPAPKKVVPASSGNMKTFRLMQGYDTKGNKVEKMQKGGFPITEKAATRKVAKGKGMMTYKYGTTDAPGTGDNKGTYVKFAKDKESNPYGGKSLKGSRSRAVMQKGGMTKKK
jgi:hypothetical protein